MHGSGAVLAWAGLPRWAEKEDVAHFENKNSFSFLFQITAHINAFWSILKAFLGCNPKTKVAQNFMLYNFTKKSKVKF
jgi:hypothetical protein